MRDGRDEVLQRRSELHGGANGRCVCTVTVAGDASVCSYDECQSDQDGPGSSGVCACRDNPINDWGTQNVCLSAGNCRVDSDCAGSLCSPSQSSTGCRGQWVGYFCRTPEDECATDADCQGGGFCAYDPGQKHWLCASGSCEPDA